MEEIDSTLRNTPRPVAAKMTRLLLMASAKTELSVKPVLIADQLLPLSVERNTPAKIVPAKMSPLAFIAKAGTVILLKPALLQVSPLSLERYTSPRPVHHFTLPFSNLLRPSPPSIIFTMLSRRVRVFDLVLHDHI